LRISRGEIGALVAMIDSAGLGGVPQASLVTRAGVAPARVASTLKELAAQDVVLAGDRLIAGTHVRKAADDLVALVAASHQAHPMSDGLPREEARERIFARVAPAVFEQVVHDLKAAKVLSGAERLALPAHKAVVAGADDQVRAAIVEAYRAGGLKPPDAAAIEAAVRAPRAIVEKVTALLLREKVLVKLDTLVFHSDALRHLKDDIVAMKASAPGGRATVDVAAFKDQYGISRKFAIPLLEYLDRERVTRRTGDSRLVL
jgi:selenocysteine-specific elongation factor